MRPVDASRYLGISVTEIYKMLESGELPGVKIEGRWRIKIDELERWLDEEVSKEEVLKLAKHLDVKEEKVKEFLKEEKGEETKVNK